MQRSFCHREYYYCISTPLFPCFLLLFLLPHSSRLKSSLVFFFFLLWEGELGQGGGRGAVGVRPAEDFEKRTDRRPLRAGGEHTEVSSRISHLTYLARFEPVLQPVYVIV